MKASVFIVFFLLALNSGFAQSPAAMHAIDSLHRQLLVTKHDSDRVMIMLEISHKYFKSNPDSVIRYGQDALALAHNINFFAGEAIASEALGLAYRGQGNIPKGLELFLEGLQISEDHQYQGLSENFLTDIGHLYRDLEDYDKAISYYQRSNKICEKAHEEGQSAFLLWNIGHIYRINKQPDSAMIYIQKAYNKLKYLLTEIDNDGYMNMIMGDIQFQLGNQRLAFEYLYKSIAISARSNNYVDRSFAYLALAGFFKEINEMDSCIYYEKKSLEDAQKIGIKIKILEASKLLAVQYESKDIKEALRYFKMADSVTEDIYGSKKVQGLQKIIANELERQHGIEAGKIAYRNKLKQYGLLAGLGVFLLIAFLLYRNNLHKQKANKVLEATLANLKATQSQLIQSEKMASLGELTAGIAHEIQNPLNFVNNFSEVNKEMLEELKAERLKPKAERDEQTEEGILNDVIANEEKINHHGKRADAIVKGMLQHSQASTGQKEFTNINTLADEYLRLSYQGFRAKDKSFNATLKTDFDETLGKINIIPQDIARVLLNLYNNAFYAVSQKQKAESKEYEPIVSINTKKIGNKVFLSVNDNGNGIPQKIVDKIFQPFFTTKPTGQGTGLGLSLAYDIIKAHGGEIKVETKEGAGTTFIILLPIV